MRYAPLTRLLHLLVAAGVTSQMLTSLAMVTPKPGQAPNLWFEMHETVGICLLVIASLYWLWVATRALLRGEGMMLFPWFSRQRLRELGVDVMETLKDLARLRLPTGSVARPLPAAVQGAGLLTMTFLAGSGTVLALGMGQDGTLSPTLHAVKELHETAAPLMWAYLVAHPLLGFLHQLAGERIVSRMFSLRSGT